MSETQWGPAWTATIGLQVRALRKEAGLSVQKLVNRCSELGFPIPRGTVANMELGTRPNVTVQEVAVLAAALGVPPVRLLYPIRDGDTRVEPVPAVSVLPVEAAEWFAGNVAWDEALPVDPSELDVARTEQRLQREVAKWVGLATELQDDVERRSAGLEPKSPWGPEDLPKFVERVAHACDQLRAHRRQMRAGGLTPPPVVGAAGSAYLAAGGDDA